ncbi:MULTISPECIES: acyl carrier protein [unclassified Nonomuraea]|uniref:acyl carrier protein n=1 Tax=unclassified Nonomuraea TaxID=2593643 RepID=UPI00340717C6
MTQADAVASLVERRLGRALDPDLNFFEAGFDSLALVELHEEITGELGLSLPVTAMFTHPNLRALSHLIAQGQAPAPARQDGARRRPLGGSRRDVRARIREEGR